MRTRILIALLGLVLNATVLAEMPEYIPECAALDSRARDIESRIMDYEVVEGQFGMTDVNAVWRAYYDGDDLVYLIERQDVGESGNADVWYWFDKRELMRYQERSHRRIVPADAPIEYQDIERTFWFKPGGMLIEAEQSCDGAGVVPIEEETHAAYGRAGGLHTQANVALQGQRAGERFFCAGQDPDWHGTLLGKRVHYQPAKRDVEIFVGTGEYKDEKKSLFEWHGKAPGYGAAATVWVREGKCKLGKKRWPLKVAMHLPAKIEVEGCCDVRPAAGLLSALDTPRKVGYRCEEGEMSVWFLRGDALAVVSLEGETYALPRVTSETGERFSGIGITLNKDGESASLMRADETVFSGCKSR